MLLGAEGSNGSNAANDGAAIFDVDIEGFEDKVLKASMDVPVIVDFWAPWCGPCKQLMPLLEQAVNEAKGAVRLAKVNIDENQELGAALRIQSVPTVFAFYKGQPVEAFAGMKPPSEIKAMIDKVVQMAGGAAAPDAIDPAEALPMAAEFIANGDIMQAQAVYLKLLEQDEDSIPAFGGLVRCLLAAGEVEQARMMIDNAPDNMAANPDFRAVIAAVEMAENMPDEGELAELAAKAAKNPDDYAARYELGKALFAGGRREEAIDELVEIIRRKRDWEDDKARKQLLEFFDVMGPSDPETIAGRRKLSSVLFS